LSEKEWVKKRKKLKKLKKLKELKELIMNKNFFEQDQNNWINQFGSDYLKKLKKFGFKGFHKIYLKERAEYELPGSKIIGDKNTIRIKPIDLPSPEALDYYENNNPESKVEIVKLYIPPQPEDYCGGYAETKIYEAVILKDDYIQTWLPESSLIIGQLFSRYDEEIFNDNPETN